MGYAKRHNGILDTGSVEAPRYVKRERDIRLELRKRPVTNTASIFKDPPCGYSGADNKRRNLSVQDALEICAFHETALFTKETLAREYGVTLGTIKHVLAGEWFDRLLNYIDHDDQRVIGIHARRAKKGEDAKPRFGRFMPMFPVPEPVSVDPLNIGWDDLTDAVCHYPTNSSSTSPTYCGHAIAPVGGAWCGFHFERVYPNSVKCEAIA
jgi:hypothetical protein